MTTHLYVEDEVPTKTCRDECGPHYFLYKEPREVSPSPEVLQKITAVTWNGTYYKSDGHAFPLGLYEGPDWNVKVAQSKATRGSGHTRFTDVQYSIIGRFATLEMAQAFEKELLYGGIIPTTPLGGGRRGHSEEQYAQMCGDVLDNTAALKTVLKRLDILEAQLSGFQLRKTIHERLPGHVSELEASLAQAWTHIQNLGQLIQDNVLTVKQT